MEKWTGNTWYVIYIFVYIFFWGGQKLTPVNSSCVGRPASTISEELYRQYRRECLLVCRFDITFALNIQDYEDE